MDIKVSIIIPNHRETFVQETIDSIKAQTYKNYEIIVVGYKKQPEKFDMYNHNFDTYVSVDKTIGLNGKINRGVKKATGEALLWIGDDDKLEPDYLEKTVLFIQDHDIVYTDMMFFGDVNGRADANNWTAENLKLTTVPFFTSLVKKEMFNKVGGWDEERYVYGDWDFWWRCFKAGATAYHLREPLFLYRRHAGQASHTDNHELARANTLDKNL